MKHRSQVRWHDGLAMRLVGLLALVVLGCTKPNPAVCCIDTADCEARGLPEVRICAAGLACVDNQCEVPTCSTEGCGAPVPVCNTTIDVCEGCTESSQCSRFPETAVCETTAGACVQCVTPTDCPAARPVCEANACRGCKLDSECASGACGDDGSCVDEAAIVYLDAGGTDAGTCPRTSPCRSIMFAVSRTAAARSHIVMALGGYVETNIDILPSSTSAPALSIHGSGATISYPSNGGDSTMLDSSLGLTIRNLTFRNPLSGAPVLALRGAAHVLDHVTLRDGVTGIVAGSSVTARDILIEDLGTGILVEATGALTIERGEIRRGATGIRALSFGSTVLITNLLVFGTSNLAIDLTMASGTINSSTIADSGPTGSGTGPRAVACSSNMTVRSSIIWAPGTVSRVPIEGCNVVSSIAGPTAAGGAPNTDPQFVDSANRDYHIAPTSPARDAVDTGPTTDFEGDARPRGTRFDIGADEAP